MNRLLLAVFGHYDSRGGTMGLALPDATCGRPKKTKRISKAAIAGVKACMKRYDKEMFGIEEPTDPIETTAYGMQAREADKAVHSIMYGDSSPGVEDFMYVAELHYPDELGEKTLEGGDLDEGETRVLIEAIANTRQGRVENMLTKWPKLKHHYEDQTIGDKNYRWLREDPEDTIRQSLINPVQLEVVRVPEGWQELHNKTYDEYWDEFESRHPFRKHASFSSNWTPEQNDIIRAAQKRWEEIEADLELLITKNANLPDMTLTRWDDDAYGFIVGVSK